MGSAKAIRGTTRVSNRPVRSPVAMPRGGGALMAASRKRSSPIADTGGAMGY
jgi:hypothetical protein